MYMFKFYFSGETAASGSDQVCSVSGESRAEGDKSRRRGVSIKGNRQTRNRNRR